MLITLNSGVASILDGESMKIFHHPMSNDDVVVSYEEGKIILRDFGGATLREFPVNDYDCIFIQGLEIQSRRYFEVLELFGISEETLTYDFAIQKIEHLGSFCDRTKKTLLTRITLNPNLETAHSLYSYLRDKLSAPICNVETYLQIDTLESAAAWIQNNCAENLEFDTLNLLCRYGKSWVVSFYPNPKQEINPLSILVRRFGYRVFTNLVEERYIHIAEIASADVPTDITQLSDKAEALIDYVNQHFEVVRLISSKSNNIGEILFTQQCKDNNRLSYYFEDGPAGTLHHHLFSYYRLFVEQDVCIPKTYVSIPQAIDILYFYPKEDRLVRVGKNVLPVSLNLKQYSEPVTVGDECIPDGCKQKSFVFVDSYFNSRDSNSGFLTKANSLGQRFFRSHEDIHGSRNLKAEFIAVILKISNGKTELRMQGYEKNNRQDTWHFSETRLSQVRFFIPRDDSNEDVYLGKLRT